MKGEDADAIDVVHRQDAAYRADGVDEDQWLSTIFFPFVICFGGTSMVLDAPQSFMLHVDRLIEIARSEGCVALRTRVLSRIKATDDMTIISSMRDRLSATGEVIASTATTWVLTRVDDEWKVSQMLFEAHRQDPSVTELWAQLQDPR